MALVGELADRKARDRRQAVIVGRCFFGVAILALLVLGGLESHSAYDERSLAGRYLAAPQCAPDTAPDGDCFAWETEQISDVYPHKGSTDVYLNGRAVDLNYMSVPSWVSGLKAGESVPVLVWEGSGQALRDPQGQVFYSQNSALDDGYNSIAGAVVLFAFALVFGAFLLVLSKGVTERRPLPVMTAITLFLIGVAGAVGGAVIQGAESVGTGTEVGQFTLLGLVFATAVVVRVRRAVLRRRRARAAASHGGPGASGASGARSARGV